MHVRSILGLLFAISAVPAMAASTPAKVIWSSPVHESTVAEPVRLVQVKFDQEVDFMSLDIEHPDGHKDQIYDAFTDPVPLPKGKEFAFTLPAAIGQAGQYYANWAASVTHADKSTDALAGFIGFIVETPQGAEGTTE